jgi:Protein of unknown function (DUF3240)
MRMFEFCLNLICPPSLEEKLLDTLLDGQGSDVFTSVPVYSHGMAHSQLSEQEKVMGRSRSMHIQILLNAQTLQQLIAQVQREFSGTGIRYWASPVAFEGEIK